jgi:hypothetical protein
MTNVITTWGHRLTFDRMSIWQNGSFRDRVQSG